MHTLFALWLAFVLTLPAQAVLCELDRLAKPEHYHDRNELSERQEAIQMAFDEAVAELKPWESHLCQTSGGCEPLSGRLLEALETKLQSKGIHLKRMAVFNNAPYSSKERDKYHYFLVDEGLGPGKEIIVDSTFAQFLKPNTLGLGLGSLTEVDSRDEVFIGTRADLEKRFADRKRQGQPLGVTLPDQVTPQELVQHLYGYGIGEGTRKDQSNDKQWKLAVERLHAKQKETYEKRQAERAWRKHNNLLQNLSDCLDDSIKDHFMDYVGNSGDLASKIYNELPANDVALYSKKLVKQRSELQSLVDFSPSVKELLRRYDVVTGSDEAAALEEIRKQFSNRAPLWPAMDSPAEFANQRAWALQQAASHPDKAPPVEALYYRRVQLALKGFTYEQFKQKYLVSP